MHTLKSEIQPNLHVSYTYMGLLYTILTLIYGTAKNNYRHYSNRTVEN